MSKSFALMIVLFFLVASCLVVAKPVSAAPVAENSWVSKVPMHQAKNSLGVAVVNGKIFAIGGSTESGVVGTNEEYDPVSNMWTFKAPMPTPSNGFVTAVCQTKIYCLGAGINEVYNTQTNKWENKSPLRILIAQANVVNDKIYVIGGYPNYTSNEVYDPATDTWTTKAPMPKAGAVAASAVLDDKIYFFGGIYEHGYVTLTEIYNPATDTWSFGTGAPTYFTVGSAAVTSGVMAPKRIYVFDQPYTHYTGIHSPFYTNQVYDPENDSWTGGADIPTSRQGFGVAVVNDTIYVIGGYSESPLVMLTQPDSSGSIYGNLTTTYYATNEQYVPFGYGTVPPVISVASPENNNYTSSEVSLNFTVNKPTNWTGYSLDGNQNVTVTGNSTVTNMTNGRHSITVYANDTFGNIGASQTVSFTIAKAEPFPTAAVAAVSGTVVAVACIGLLLYYRKRSRGLNL